MAHPKGTKTGIDYKVKASDGFVGLKIDINAYLRGMWGFTANPEQRMNPELDTLVDSIQWGLDWDGIETVEIVKD